MRHNKNTKLFKMKRENEFYILLKRLIFFKKNKMFSAYTSLNKSFRLLL